MNVRFTTAFAAWCFMLCATACRGDQGQSTPEGPVPGVVSQSSLFSLDLAAGERLINIHHNDAEQHGDAAFEISHEGSRQLWHRGAHSPVFEEIDSVGFFGPANRSVWALVSVNGKQMYVVHGGEVGSPFVQTGAFDRFDQPLVFGVEQEQLGLLGRGEDVVQLVLWNGKALEEGPTGQHVLGLEHTPDKKAVQYGIRAAERWFYGVNNRVFLQRSEWVQLGDTGPLAMWGKDGQGTTVFVDHQPGATYDTLKDFHIDPDGTRLFYQGATEDGWWVVSESRLEGEQPKDIQGPFQTVGFGVEGEVTHHPDTRRPYYAAGTDEGLVFVVGIGANKSAKSEPYQKLIVKPFTTKTSPVAIARAEDGLHVLLGTKVGPVFDSIWKLAPADNETTVAYIGQRADGLRVVLGDTVQAPYAEIHHFTLTEPSKRPAYVGLGPEGFAVVHGGETSEPYAAVTQLETRGADQIAYLAKKGRKWLVGLDSVEGEEFDAIESIQVTRTGKVWFDGIRNGLHHRSINHQVSNGYTALGVPKITEVGDRVVYAARSGRLDIGAKGGRSVHLVENVVAENEVVASFERDLPGNRTGMRFLAGTPHEMVYVSIVRDSDHYFFVAEANEGVSVGFDGVVDGPFQEISELRVHPNRSRLVYFGKKDGTWAIQDGRKRGEELDEVASLGFTPDKRQLFYGGKKAGVWYSFVDSERYLSVKEMKLNANGDVLTYQGQRDDGWHLVVGGKHSDAFLSLGETGFNPDGYGVHTNALHAAGESFLIREYEGVFRQHVSWDAVGTPTFHYNPLAQGVLFRDQVIGGFLLANNDASTEGERQLSSESLLDPLPDIDTVPLFVGLGTSPSDIRSAWLVDDIDSGRLHLRNGPEEKGLAWARRQGLQAFVLPIYAPYSYVAWRDGRKGVSYADNFYRGMTVKPFGIDGSFVALAWDKSVYMVIGDRRTPGYDDITNLLWNEHQTKRPLVAFKAQKGDKFGWVMTQDVDGAETQGVPVVELGMLDRVEDARWSEPYVDNGTNVLLWSGFQGEQRVQGVHDQAYDEVRDFAISPTKGTLTYVGVRGDRESVFHGKKHHDWYSSIGLLSVSGSEGVVNYVGSHHYVQEPDPTLRRGERVLSRVVVGDEAGPYTDGIGFLFPASRLAETVWTGKENGLWSLFYGTERRGGSYHAIRWLQRVGNDLEPPTQSTYHYLARTADHWVEVHDGKEGVEVDALVVQADLATPIPSSMVEVAELPGAAVAGEVLADANGQFDYRGVMGENQVFVHKGTIGEPARSIGRTWYFNDGDAWVYEAFQKDGLQVVVNGDGSPLGDTVVRDPEWSQGTQDVFTVLALPASDPEPSKESVETETAEGAGVPTEVNPDPALLVLKNATELVRGHEVQRVEVLDEGLGLFVRQDDAWHAFAGERLGPGFEQVSLEPGPVWGEKLNSSRYVAGFDGDWYVAAHNLVRGPFDEVTALFRSGYQNDSVVYSGVRGQVERAFIDDDLVAEAESVGVYEDLVALAHGDTLLIPQIDANQLELVGPDNTYSLVDNPEPVENVLALTNKDSTRLVIGDEMVEAKWVFFDVRLETAEDDSMATLSWVDGTLNRDKATLELVASTLNVAVPAGGLDSVFPLADIPLEGEVEAEIQIEESTEGEDERPSDPVSAESTDADGNTAG